MQMPNFYAEPKDTQGPNVFGEEPQDTQREPLFSKFNDMECSPDDPLEQAQYLLLPGYVLGFAVGQKKWGKSW